MDILIGTQILAKGHHFPSLTLVGIVDADLGLMGSDLRASEQTFQLLSQVSGRAGRGEKKGTVYLQTLYPENAVLQALIANDRDKFLTLEKKTRRILKMPPYGKLAAIIVSGANRDQTENVAVRLGQAAPNTDCISTAGAGAGADLHAARQISLPAAGQNCKKHKNSGSCPRVAAPCGLSVKRADRSGRRSLLVYVIKKRILINLKLIIIYYPTILKEN